MELAADNSGFSTLPRTYDYSYQPLDPEVQNPGTPINDRTWRNYGLGQTATPVAPVAPMMHVHRGLPSTEFTPAIPSMERDTPISNAQTSPDSTFPSRTNDTRPSRYLQAYVEDGSDDASPASDAGDSVYEEVPIPIPTTSNPASRETDTRRQRKKKGEKGDESGPGSSNAQPKPARQRHKRYLTVGQATRKERNHLIGQIKRYWGTRWLDQFPRNLIPYGVQEGKLLGDPRDWSTTLLAVLKELSNVTRKESGRAGNELLRKANERVRSVGGNIELLIVDVEAVIPDNKKSNSPFRPPPRGPPPNGGNIRIGQRASTSPWYANSNDEAPFIAAHPQSRQPSRPIRPSPEIADLPIKVETDNTGTARVKLAADGHAAAGTFKIMADSQKRMQEQMDIQAKAAARIDLEKRIQAQELLKTYGHAAGMRLTLTDRWLD